MTTKIETLSEFLERTSKPVEPGDVITPDGHLIHNGGTVAHQKLIEELDRLRSEVTKLEEVRRMLAVPSYNPWWTLQCIEYAVRR